MAFHARRSAGSEQGTGPVTLRAHVVGVDAGALADREDRQLARRLELIIDQSEAPVERVPARPAVRGERGARRVAWIELETERLVHEHQAASPFFAVVIALSALLRAPRLP